MKQSKRLPIKLGIIVAAIAGLSGMPAFAADDALIAAAKKEAEVNWYTTQIITQIGRPMMEAFQKKYGIRVNAVRGDSVELAVRLLNEAKAGRMQADVFDGTTTSVSLKKAGIAVNAIEEAPALRTLVSGHPHWDYAIDALLGTGARGTLRWARALSAGICTTSPSTSRGSER
jgi:ABC-type thiamine transport system substrate-binding protein